MMPGLGIASKRWKFTPNRSSITVFNKLACSRTGPKSYFHIEHPDSPIPSHSSKGGPSPISLRYHIKKRAVIVVDRSGSNDRAFADYDPHSTTSICRGLVGQQVVMYAILTWCGFAEGFWIFFPHVLLHGYTRGQRGRRYHVQLAVHRT